jgi:hypothetical protein
MNKRADESDPPAFLSRIGLAAAAAAAIGAAALILLMAFGDEFRSGEDGNAHALAINGTGFQGVARLLAASEGLSSPRIVRNRAAAASAPLLIATPQSQSSADALIGLRAGKPTLVILDKWFVGMDPKRRGWVRVNGPAQNDVLPITAGGATFNVTYRDARKGERLAWAAAGLSFPAPNKLLLIRTAPPPPPKMPKGIQRQLRPPAPDDGDGPPPYGKLEPLIATDGGIVLGKVPGKQVWVLADPDLISNQALTSPEAARRAVALIHALPNGDRAVWDVTLVGLGRTPNLARLALEPPYLGVTLALGLAALAALWRASARFGPIERERERAYGFGPGQLIDNAADLAAQARAEAEFAGRYAAMIGERYSRRRRAPDALVTLSAAARDAQTPTAALKAAQDLWDWNRTHDRR